MRGIGKRLRRDFEKAIRQKVGEFWEEMQDIYEPGYPPMSPVTNSYFACWIMFDVPFGQDKETFGSCFSGVTDLLELDPIRTEALANLCASRMGVYEIQGADGKYWRLRELVTEREVVALIPSGFKGRAGGLIYTRVLPPVGLPGAHHVSVTTPYLLIGFTRHAWIEYFQSQQILGGAVGFESRLQRHMKEGNNPRYWLEFVFCGYFNHRSDAVFLHGIPNKPETLPHHKQYERRLLNRGLIEQQLT